MTVCMLLSVSSAVFAADSKTYGPYEYDDIAVASGPSEILESVSAPKWQKNFYNVLNKVANMILDLINMLYPNPKTVVPMSDYDDSLYLTGREVVRRSAADGASWRVGYASASIVPDDFAPDEYYIGRSLLNIKAVGVNDDNRVRVTAIDDGTGDGMVIFAVTDGLGVTAGDTLAVRRAVLDWADAAGIKICSINLGATHSHTALDTQGVATESIYKILTGAGKNVLGVTEDPKLDAAERFKLFYVNAVISAVKAAVADMREGRLFYSSVDCSDIVVDKRGLVDTDKIPDIAVFRFDPDDGSAGVYIADVPCHPTSFDSGLKLLSADYIYYAEQRIEQRTGYRFQFMQGASGMLTRNNTGINESALPEDERVGATTRYTGKVFGDRIVDGAQNAEELSAVLNVRFSTFMLRPENGILRLALKSQLVNDTAYKKSILPNDIYIPIEMGYIEFGSRAALCLFPVELYPEVFYGTSIINGGDYAAVSWSGETFDYPVPAELAPRDGIDMFAAHLMNDSLGYCVPDPDFAFLGHIIIDGNADESLSLGGHTASQIVTEFAALMRAVKDAA